MGANASHNKAITVLASGARTTTQNGVDIVNTEHRGIEVVVDITSGAGLSLTVTIEAKDELSGKYYALLASSALSGTGTTRLVVYPGIAVAANASANTFLPFICRVNVTAGNGTSATYSVGAVLLI